MEKDLLDRIERSIDIAAPAESVWALIARPGWWINEGDVDGVAAVRDEGDVHVITHPTYGEFRVRTLEADPPRTLTYQWLDDGDRIGTRVEFTIEDAPGGVILRVIESGFADLDKDRETIRQRIAENTDGWEQELDAARRFVLGADA